MKIRIKTGDRVKLINPEGMSKETLIGATALVTRGEFSADWADGGIGIEVKWDKNERCKNQMDGGYSANSFERICKFMPGDRVKLIDARYYSGSEIKAGAIGIITDTHSNRGNGWYDVRIFHKGKTILRGMKNDSKDWELTYSAPKEELNAKKKKIINEIKANPEFGKCFSSVSAIKKEVNDWDDQKILGWQFL